MVLPWPFWLAVSAVACWVVVSTSSPRSRRGEGYCPAGHPAPRLMRSLGIPPRVTGPADLRTGWSAKGEGEALHVALGQQRDPPLFDTREIEQLVETLPAHRHEAAVQVRSRLSAPRRAAVDQHTHVPSGRAALGEHEIHAPRGDV